MELILSIVVYTIQILGIVFFAGIVPALVFLIKKNKKTFCVMFCLCLAVEVIGISFLMKRPLWICPPEYEKYISAEDQNTLIGINSGIYSDKIPTIAACIFVKNADQNNIEVETYYLMFGRAETSLSDDGLSGTKLR